MTEHTEMRLKHVQHDAVLVAASGMAVCFIGFWWLPARFFEAYLFAFLVVSGIGLGSLAIVMLKHLVGGQWGFATLRILEAASWPLVITPLLALPLIMGIDSLYPWADDSLVQHDELLLKKTAYLNTQFFCQRALGYLTVWAVIALLLSWWSRSPDDEPDTRATRGNWLRKLSAIGLVFYVLLTTFSAVDWMMSLEPHWFSAIYGVIVIAGQCAAALAAAIATLCLLRTDPHLSKVATHNVLQDLGNLLLAAVTFWIYVTFSQFLIVWSGNLVEEVPWYLARSTGGWQWVALAVILLHFVAPFIALLSQQVKRDPRHLATVAIVVFIAHLADVYWLVIPAMRDTFRIHWLDVTTLVTLGAAWKALAVWRLRTAELVPKTSDAEGMEYGEFAAHQPG